MTTTVQLTLGTLIDDTLARLYRNDERPRQVTLGGNTLTSSSSDTTFNLASGHEAWLGTQQLVEFDSEVVLVTAKSNDATPEYTCSRGYLGTTLAAHTGTGLVDPLWTRKQVEDAIKKLTSGKLNVWLPQLTSAVFTPVVVSSTTKQFIEMPTNAMQVFDVRWQYTTSGKMIHFDSWDFEQTLPALTGITTGKAVVFSKLLASDQNLIVTYQTPWGFSDTTEAGVISAPVGASNLFELYASAYLLTGHELTRLEVDGVDEWSKEASIRQGQNRSMIRDAWQAFYNELDEARRIHPVPKRRVYRRLRGF